MAYLGAEKTTQSNECIFCVKARAINEGALQTEHIVARSRFVFVTLNLFPYNNGHLMVVPYEHIPSLEALSPEALSDLMQTTNLALAALRRVYNPQAFNVGANIGAAAGAGIAAHFHLHVVPRWNGDANYMSTIANTRVIPDLLDDTWRKLRAAWPTQTQTNPNQEAKSS